VRTPGQLLLDKVTCSLGAFLNMVGSSSTKEVNQIAILAVVAVREGGIAVTHINLTNESVLVLAQSAIRIVKEEMGQEALAQMSAEDLAIKCGAKAHAPGQFLFDTDALEAFLARAQARAA
jgi:hypothetical protein